MADPKYLSAPEYIYEGVVRYTNSFSATDAGGVLYASFDRGSKSAYISSLSGDAVRATGFSANSAWATTYMASTAYRAYEPSKTYYTELKPYSALSSDYTMFLPSGSGSSGQSLFADGGGGTFWRQPKKTFEASFALSEFVSNTTKYFYSWRAAGNTQEDAKRSGSSNGLAYANSCSPIQMPFSGRMVRAVLSLQGAGVNQAAASYPCQYQVQFYRVGWTTEHDGNINSGSPIQINFPVASGVGAYTIGSVNSKLEKTDTTSIVVSPGDMMALKFLNGSTASAVGLSQQAYVTLTFEEI